MEHWGIAYDGIARLFLPEFDCVLMFLAPLDEAALVVFLFFSHAFNVDVVAEYILFEESVAIVVASVS